MTAFWPIAVVLAVTSVAMLFGWLLQLRTRNAGIVDAIWAACMGGSALFYASVGGGSLIARLGVAMLGGAWAFRLCLHILARLLSEHEDGRYRYLREHWRDHQGKFLAFFQAQALLTALFSLPFFAVAENQKEGMTRWCFIGIAVWLVSIIGEAVADWQLSHWRRDPRHHGITCRAGLWRYSRHPNYFFEWLHWFAYVFLAIGTPFSIWLLSLLGPVLMLVSLCWVTGIPFVEAQALRSRGEDYREYQRTTSAFVPWFPKSRDEGRGVTAAGASGEGRGTSDGSTHGQ
jgi:steroid 5-alpha reductase family enzyme